MEKKGCEMEFQRHATAQRRGGGGTEGSRVQPKTIEGVGCVGGSGAEERLESGATTTTGRSDGKNETDEKDMQAKDECSGRGAATE